MRLKWNMMILCVILCMSVAVSACGKKKNQSQEEPDSPQKDTVVEIESDGAEESDKDEIESSDENSSGADSSGEDESEDFGDVFTNQSGGSSDNKKPPADKGDSGNPDDSNGSNDSENPDNSNTDGGNSKDGLTETQDPNGNISFGPIY